ncbi:MAG: glutamine synthetase family protein [Myxococcales bacterium]|nr:glutamine synthetase family protein [Myxococcales bacterium]
MDKKELEQKFEEAGIRRVKVGGFDIDGILRGKYISLEKFWSAVEKGFGFCDVIFGWDLADALYDNSKLTGWHTGYPDTLAKLDLDSFRILPSEPHTAHFLADFWLDPSTPHPACPRNLLRTVTARAHSAGYRPKLSAEFEFWLFRETPATLREKGMRDLTALSPGMFGYSWVRSGQHVDLLEDVMDQLDAYGIEIEGLHTETGPGVYEAAIRYSDPVRAADMAALFKTTMKILTPRHGCTVTFMAKWHPELPGSSGHLHQSLFDSDDKENLFADAKAEHGLSAIARHYLGGMVQLTPDFTALFAPTVNSYKRFVPGMWAPMSATWAVENRTCSIRAINKPSASSTRLELRQTAADINPYIAMAASLGAGLYGVEHAIEPPPPSQGDATEGEGAPRIPPTLRAAIDALEKSERAREVLPEAFIDHYLRTRDYEDRQYRKSVSQWELERYFEAI